MNSILRYQQQQKVETQEHDARLAQFQLNGGFYSLPYPKGFLNSSVMIRLLQ